MSQDDKKGTEGHSKGDVGMVVSSLPPLESSVEGELWENLLKNSFDSFLAANGMFFSEFHDFKCKM